MHGIKFFFFKAFDGTSTVVASGENVAEMESVVRGADCSGNSSLWMILRFLSGKPHKKVPPLMVRALMPYPPPLPPQSLMAIGTIFFVLVLKKTKKFFFLNGQAFTGYPPPPSHS